MNKFRRKAKKLKEKEAGLLIGVSGSIKECSFRFFLWDRVIHVLPNWYRERISSEIYFVKSLFPLTPLKRRQICKISILSTFDFKGSDFKAIFNGKSQNGGLLWDISARPVNYKAIYQGFYSFNTFTPLTCHFWLIRFGTVGHLDTLKRFSSFPSNFFIAKFWFIGKDWRKAGEV